MTLSSDLFTLHHAPNGDQHQLCNLCTARYAWKKGSGSGSLKQHYASKHPLALIRWQQQKQGALAATEELQEDMQSVASSALSLPSKRAAAATAADSGSASSLSPTPKRSKLQQSTLQQSFLPSSNATVSKQMALFFATNHIAHHVADSHTFRAFIDAVRASTLPSRKLVKASISSLADEMRKQLLGRLQSQASVAIAVDGWTNVRQTKVTNLVLICNGRSYYWCSIANKLERNTAAWMFQVMAPKLQELVAAGVRFAAFIADNEAVNGALFDLLREPFPFLVQVPCAAHTIQLVVKGVMACARWKKVQATVNEILRAFGTCKDARLRLRTLQQGELREYCLVKANDTRWNSEMHAASRLLLLRRFVDIIYNQTAEFWSELDSYITFLKPFQVATDVVQRDSSTLFDVFQQWSVLATHISKSEDAAMKKECMAHLKERWQGQVNTAATNACAVLSLDADMDALEIEPELIEDARRFIVTFGYSYMHFFKLSSLSEDELLGKLRIQLGQFTARRERFVHLDDEVRTTRNSATAAWSALDVWALYEMELSVVARVLLSMPASEAAVERTFSAQGAVHSKLRNRLHDHSVEQEMFVAFNHGALTRDAPVHVRTVVELTASFQEVDTESETEEQPEEENESSPAAAAAAAAAMPSVPEAPLRTQSEINADNRAFLEQYIEKYSIQLGTRWNDIRTIELEAAALGNNPGGYSTQQLKQQIRYILEERKAAAPL